MARFEFYHDPSAPTPNTLIPACNLLVVNDQDQLLLQKRRDTGQWALPGGAQDIGEKPSECAIRECQEETGITAAVTGLLGVFSDPDHVVLYSDGEARQQFEITLIGHPVDGEPTINDEASDVAWVRFDELSRLDIHPSMLRQIATYTAGVRGHVD